MSNVIQFPGPKNKISLHDTLMKDPDFVARVGRIKKHLANINRLMLELKQLGGVTDDEIALQNRNSNEQQGG